MRNIKMGYTHATLRRSLRVLVAEDEALIGLAIEVELVERGHEVVRARDGQAALEAMARSGPFDAVVTDMQMPRLRGDELIRRLRGEQPDLPIVMVSANPSRGTIDALRALGGPFSFLNKPVLFNLIADEIVRLATGGTG